MHRNYRTRQPVQVIRYSNRIEFKNPGCSLKPDDRLGEPGSVNRNEKLAAILHECNLAETKGSCIRVMRDLMDKANLTLPLFESDRNADTFTVTLLTHHFMDPADLEWLTLFRDCNLSDDEARTLVFIKEVGAVNNEAYRDINKVDTLTASGHLRKLRNHGLLEQQGCGSGTYYVPGKSLLDSLSSNLDALSGNLAPLSGNLNPLSGNLDSEDDQETHSEARELLMTVLPENIQEDIAAGSVISQNPAAGIELAPGTAVSIVVSLGAIPTVEGEPPVDTTAAQQRLAEAFALVDVNGDGKLSFTEAVAAFPGLTQAMFDALDTKGDGLLSPEELGMDANSAPSGCQGPGLGSIKEMFSILYGLFGLVVMIL